MNIIVSKRWKGHACSRSVAGTVLLALAVLAGCGDASGPAGSGPGADGAHTTLDVVTSTDVYGDIARRIGGDGVRVSSLITDPAADPHSYEATTRNQLQLAKADVVLENGGGYDDFVGRMLRSSDSRAVVLDAVEISGRSAPPGLGLNEHVWYDVPSMARLTDRLVATLSAADPARTARYRAAGDAFGQELRRLEDAEAELRRAHAGTGVAVTEPVPLYLLEACGLRNLTPVAFSEAIEEGNDVPAPVLRETLDLVADRQVRVLAYNEQTSGPQTQEVLATARAHGVAVLPVTETLPAGQDYISWMSGTLAALRAALR